MLLVERELVGGKSISTCIVAVTRYKCKDLRADTSPVKDRYQNGLRIGPSGDLQGALVGIPAGVGQLKTIVDNGLVVEQLPAL